MGDVACTADHVRNRRDRLNGSDVDLLTDRDRDIDFDVDLKGVHRHLCVGDLAPLDIDRLAKKSA